MSLYGMNIVVVAWGTEVSHAGMTLTVTDEHAVTKGNTIYVTQPTYDRLKAEAKPAP